MSFDSHRFALDVHALVRLIPKGKVSTYGAIAHALLEPSRSRLVGWALNRSPVDVPAHRVVNRNGVLTGHQFFGGDKMQALRKEEGVEVVENKVKNFKHVFWSPVQDLSCEE